MQDLHAKNFILRVAPPAPAGPSVLVATPGERLMGVRGGQTLVVGDGAPLGPNFNAGLGSVVNIEEGAVVGDDFEVVREVVHVYGGSIQGTLDAYHGSAVEVLGGYVAGVKAGADASIVLGGAGVVGSGLASGANGSLLVSGGAVGSLSTTDQGRAALSENATIDRVTVNGEGIGLLRSHFLMSGGEITGFLRANEGYSFRPGGAVTISGGVLSGSLEIPYTAEAEVHGGTIQTPVALGGRMTVTGGRFEQGLSVSQLGNATFRGGEFFGAVSTAFGANMQVSGGVFHSGFNVSGVVSGGLIGDDAFVTGEISGGTFGERLRTSFRSLRISGGTFGNGAKADSSSDLLIVGGDFGHGFTADSGADPVGRVVHHHRGAARGQLARDRRPDSLRRAGHQRNPTLQLRHALCPHGHQGCVSR